MRSCATGSHLDLGSMSSPIAWAVWRLARQSPRTISGPAPNLPQTDFVKQTGVDPAGDLLERFHFLRRQHVKYEPANLTQVDRLSLHQLLVALVCQFGVGCARPGGALSAHPAPRFESRDHMR